MRSPAGRDRVRRFIVENQPVRGHWVRLNEAWRELRARSDYPPPVRSLLGQAVAASVLLAATLKFRGRLTLQLQGEGAVNLLVAQCTHDFGVRAIAHFDEAQIAELSAEAPAGVSFRALTGTDGRFTVTIEADERNLRYQGIVPLSGETLAESLEAYFSSSEQLPTRVRLAADDEGSAGLLIQKLPRGEAEPAPADAWASAQGGIARLSTEALLHHPVEEALGQGLPGHDLRLFRGASVRFECRCGDGRVSTLLRALGAEEVSEMLSEQGAVTVTCEFCGRPYRFDARDIEALFVDGPDTSLSVH